MGLFLAFVLQWPSLYQGMLVMLLSQFPLSFLLVPSWILLFITHLVVIHFVDCDGVVNDLRVFPWEDVFNLGAFAAASSICW